LECDNAGDPFVVVVYVAATSSQNIGLIVAEGYDPATGMLLNPAQSFTNTPTTPGSDDSFYGGGWVNVPFNVAVNGGVNLGFKFSAGSTGSILGAWVNEDSAIFDMTGGNGSFNGPYWSGVGWASGGHGARGLWVGAFTSLVANPALTDPKPFGMCSFASSATGDTAWTGAVGSTGTTYTALFLPTRAPGMYAAGTTVTRPGRIIPWIDNSLTEYRDPYINGVVGDGATPFTAAVFVHAEDIGAVARGTTTAFLFSAAGSSGDEVLMPGLGTYRKFSTNPYWVKVGDV